MEPTESDPFSAYHRAARRMRLSRAIGIVAFVALSAGFGYVIGSAAPQSLAGVRSSSAVDRAPADSSAPSGSGASSGSGQTASAEDGALPQPPSIPAQAPATDTPVTLPTTGPTTWSIAIATTGYQAEIDRCQWVRMDLGAAAPIVGAHNYCGGDIVLAMAVGDTVTLSGTNLDGTYSVTADRDAHAGDRAGIATSGMIADVILQTCYWSSNGEERLIALARR